MKYIGNLNGDAGASKILAAGLTLVASIDVSNADVVSLRLENTGASSLTDFELRASVARGATADELAVSSWTTDDGLILTRPASVTPVTLAAGASTRLSVNVSDSTDLQIWASGAGATLTVEAGIYEVAQ